MLYGNDVSKKQLPNLFDVKERMRNFNDVMEGSVDDLKLPSTFENELGHLLGVDKLHEIDMNLDQQTLPEVILDVSYRLKHQLSEAYLKDIEVQADDSIDTPYVPKYVIRSVYNQLQAQISHFDVHYFDALAERINDQYITNIDHIITNGRLATPSDILVRIGDTGSEYRSIVAQQGNTFKLNNECVDTYSIKSLFKKLERFKRNDVSVRENEVENEVENDDMVDPEDVEIDNK